VNASYCLIFIQSDYISSSVDLGADPVCPVDSGLDNQSAGRSDIRPRDP